MTAQSRARPSVDIAFATNRRRLADISESKTQTLGAGSSNSPDEVKGTWGPEAKLGP